MADLVLPVKRIYFDQIKAGTKHEEFRLTTEHWKKRLIGKTYDRVVITLGYPKADDTSRRQTFTWQGYRTTRLTHPHFGSDEVEVFAIKLYDWLK